MENSVPPYSGGTPPIIVHTPPPPPPPRRGGGFLKFLGVLFLIAALLIAGLFALSFLAGSLLDGPTSAGAQSGKKLHEITVDNPTATDKIAIIDVEGMITSASFDGSGRSMVDLFADELKHAAEDEDVKAVLLKVDSPGGEVMASDDMADAIRKFQDKHKKPVVAVMGSLAASGGYYISAPCRWIVANDLTLTGSIGVIMHTINFRGLMDKVGVQPTVFKSGKFKDMLSATKKPEEIDPAEREMIQSMVMETYEKFKQVVAEGRAQSAKANKDAGRKLISNWTDYADGRVLTGKQAYEHGFVDEIGNFEAAIERTKKIAGIAGPAKLIRYEEPFTFGSLFGMLGKSDTKTIKIEAGLDFPKIQAGRPYFLSPTLLH